MGLFEGTHYRRRRSVTGSAVDDDERARFPGDTDLPPQTEFVIVSEKRPWPRPDSPLCYLIELRSPGTTWEEGGRYAVPADELEAAMEAA